jgi:starch synthase
MDILMVTPEVAPYSRVGALGDMCGALPKALRGLGHRVTVFSPLYAGIDPVQRSLARRLMKLEVTLGGGRKLTCELYDGRTSAGVELLFLGHEDLFRRTPYVYGPPEAYLKDAERFALLSLGAVDLLRKREPTFDVVHAHGWPASLSLLMASRDASLRSIPRVLTVHDIAHQGNFPRDTVERLGLPWDLFNPEGLEFYGQVSFLKSGIIAADRITTVSPTYAREIQTTEGGYGFDGVLRQRADAITGILDGIDVSIWNPATDPHLESRYDPFDLAGKGRCKTALQREVGLPVRPDVPLVCAPGVVSREAGLDLLAKAMPQVLRNDVQVVLQRGGDAELLEVFEELASRWPDRVALAAEGEPAAHRLIGAADLVVAAARRDPTALLARAAQRYGALPVARRASGVVDAVVDCDAALESGTGFLYDEPTPQALLGAVRRGLAAFALGEPFRKAAQRAMRIDCSWERAARLYEAVYAELLNRENS